MLRSAFAGAIGLLWAFAGATDNIATARPATKIDAAFMAVSSLVPGQQIPSRSVMCRLSIANWDTANHKPGPPRVK